MKKILTLFLAFVLMFSMVGCKQPAPSGNSGLTLSTTNLSLSINSKQTIFANFKGEGTITWATSDKSIVSIIPNGNSVSVLALKAGKAEVTAELGSSKATCYVTVTNPKFELALELGVEAVEIRNGGSLYVPATVSLGNEVLEDVTYTYTIADTSIATVTDGVVTGVKEGDTSLSVVAEYQGRKSNVVTVPVTVKSGSVLIVNVASVTLYDLNTNSEAFPIEETLIVKLSNGETASVVTFTATSSNEDVAVVESGVIKAKSEGEAIIEISHQQGGINYTAKVYVNVKPAPMIVFKFDEVIELYALKEGKAPETLQLQPKVYLSGEEITATGITYELIEGNVITVTESGLVTSASAIAGDAVVKVKFVFQGKEYTDTVNVSVIPVHVCEVSTTYSYDANYHWFECVSLKTCTEIFDKAVHSYVNGVCVCGAEEGALRFGQTDRWAHDSVLAELSEGQKLTISNVTLPTVSETGTADTDVLARFILIPEKNGVNVFKGFKCPYGAASIYITITDVADESNFLKILIIQYNTDAPETHAIVGAFPSSYGEIVDGKYASISKHTGGLCGEAGWTHSGYGITTSAFSFAGYHLGRSDYTWGMMGLVLDNTTLSYQIATSDFKTLGDYSQDLAGYTAQTPWAGFSGPVNITFELGRFANGATTSTLAFDMVAGTALTADSLVQFSIA